MLRKTCLILCLALALTLATCCVAAAEQPADNSIVVPAGVVNSLPVDAPTKIVFQALVKNIAWDASTGIICIETRLAP